MIRRESSQWGEKSIEQFKFVFKSEQEKKNRFVSSWMQTLKLDYLLLLLSRGNLFSEDPRRQPHSSTGHQNMMEGKI